MLTSDFCFKVACEVSRAMSDAAFRRANVIYLFRTKSKEEQEMLDRVDAAVNGAGQRARVGGMTSYQKRRIHGGFR